MKREDPWFDEVYQKYSPQLFKAAAVLLDDEWLAEEIVQDVFVVLLLHREEVEHCGYLRAWLYRVLRNRIGSEIQRAFHSRELPLLPEHENLPASTGRRRRLEDLLPKSLRPEDRQLLIWFFEDGLSHEEIAARLGCSLHASHMRLYRAKQRCARLLLNHGFDPRDPSP